MRTRELTPAEHARIRRQILLIPVYIWLVFSWTHLLVRIPRIVTAETKAEMKRVLDDIQSGRFARNWMLENKINQASFKAMRKKMSEHPIEEIGAKLRGMMPWIKEKALVDRSRN